MEATRNNILIVDDEEDMLLLYKNLLKDHYNLTTTTSGSQALKIAARSQFDIALIDVIMPEMNGIEVLKKIKSMDSSMDVIMVTASKEVKPAIESLKFGAFDYIIKPFEIEDLLMTIKKALERRSIIRENLYLKQALNDKENPGELIGKSDAIKHIFKVVENVSKSDSTVLITGESGTGKEVVARTIHNNSNRTGMPYVIVNCAAIPENLLESEMFGHERGAFTGAHERHIGKFELADGGTIFLDEIGEMPLPMQVKLLRVVQENTIMRVGGEKTIPIDVRIIAATNIDIKKAINEKKFREDLYYRLNVIPITMPPLRDRLEDIPLFIASLIDKYNKELNRNVKALTNDALRILRSYPWPGNIRELENLIERIMTLSNEEYIDIDQIPRDFMDHKLYKKSDEFTIQDGSLLKASKNFEKKLIREAMAAAKNNQTVAAKLLGVHRTTLISKLDAHGIKD